MVRPRLCVSLLFKSCIKWIVSIFKDEEMGSERIISIFLQLNRLNILKIKCIYNFQLLNNQSYIQRESYLRVHTG